MQHGNNIRICSLLFCLLCASCATYEPFYSEGVKNWQAEIPDPSAEPDYSVFLIGGTAKAYTNDTLLSLLEDQLTRAGKESAAIFLGNQVHPNGLPDSTYKTWDLAHASLMAQLKILENYKGEIIAIPGIHDWAGGRKEGLEYVKNQRKYMEDYLDENKVFLPKKGRPGPVEVHLSKDIVLILIDSYWWCGSSFIQRHCPYPDRFLLVVPRA
jgi:hypothetical protein